MICADPGNGRKVAIQLATQMAESEARRMRALKTQQALQAAQQRKLLPAVTSPSIAGNLR